MERILVWKAWLGEKELFVYAFGESSESWNNGCVSIVLEIVTSEFKEAHIREFRCAKTEHKMIEQEIVDKFLTEAFIDKEFEKIQLKKDGWSSKYISELFGRIWHEFITEECWNIIKKMKNLGLGVKVKMEEDVEVENKFFDSL